MLIKNKIKFLKVDNIKNILEVIQGIAVITAIIIGGGWTLYTFISLEAVNKAKIELEEMKQKLIKRAVLDINLTAKNETENNQTEYYISAVVTITNKGSREILLDFSSKPLFSTPLSISKVNFDKKGKPVFRNTQAYKINTNRSVIDAALLPDEKIRLTFYAKVKEAGIYYIEFSVPQKGIEREEHKKLKNNKPLDDTIYTNSLFLKIN